MCFSLLPRDKRRAVDDGDGDAGGGHDCNDENENDHSHGYSDDRSNHPTNRQTFADANDQAGAVEN